MDEWELKEEMIAKQAMSRVYSILDSLTQEERDGLLGEIPEVDIDYIQSDIDACEVYLMLLHVNPNKLSIKEYKDIVFGVRSRLCHIEAFIELEKWFPDNNHGLDTWNLLKEYKLKRDKHKIGRLVHLARVAEYELFLCANEAI